jgi:hypothetical protein
MAVERSHLLAQLAPVQALIYAAQQMIDGYVRFETKRVEQLILLTALLTHQCRALATLA